ncbi:MFS transporter [Amycolatopsis vancoresmycina]|uniref:Major facilitator transporter n=1 Tax=Amycolatopsis vancoresmycina DSM 44592 TaxID=1292037 RepID=R1I1B7_9PSEU|nr:MFS transporter [Amycolatopsis vancoresmycina]EOD64259.1 major facilitator transporter [Amycolatopsis vancoresmycina DSM 44592]
MSQQTLHPAPVAAVPRRSGLVLAIILTCQLMLVLDATVMNVALPRIQSDLGFSATGLSWVMTAYSLVFGGLLLLGGRAGDLFGRRRMFVAGIAVFTLASLAGGLAGSAALLIAARALQGVGAAMAGPSTLALITTTFTEPKARVRALALFSAMSSGGFAIGLIVGGLLTEWFSWRAALFINVPFGLAIAVLAPRFVAEPERRRAHLDLPGAITGTLGVGALVFAFTHAASDGWGNPVTLGSLAAGLALLAGFVVLEARTALPLVPLRLFAERNRSAAYVNFFLAPMAMMSMFFFLTQFMQDIRHFAALATGFAFLPMAALIFTMSRLVPRLLPRYGPKPLALTGSVLMVAGVGWLALLTTDSTYLPALLGPLLLMGLGGGLAFAPLNVIIMATVPPEDAGAAGGVLQTMQQVGSTLGLAVLVTVFGSATRSAAAAGTTGPQLVVDGMTSAFSTAAVIAAGTVLVALTFRRATASARP